jgi:hypothetical protein
MNDPAVDRSLDPIGFAEEVFANVAIPAVIKAVAQGHGDAPYDWADECEASGFGVLAADLRSFIAGHFTADDLRRCWAVPASALLA